MIAARSRQQLLDKTTFLEQLNRSLQAENTTVSGMMKAVESVITELNNLRTEERFRFILDEVRELVALHDLNELTIPRVRRPPVRFSGPAEAHVAVR